MQRQQVAEGEAAVDDVRLRVACGHPLVVRLQCHGLARGEAAFGGLVVFRAVHPGVVGDLVVVPHGDHGRGGVQRLQVGIGPVLGMARAVVGQAQDLVGRLGQAAQRRRVARGVAALAVFVEVVAQVHGGVQVAAPGGIGVHVEVAGRVVGAREHGQLHLGHAARGQGAGASRGRGGLEGLEAVVVGGGGLQARGVHLDRVVARGAGAHLAARHDAGEGGVAGHLPLHGDLGTEVGGRRDARPEHDAVGQRVAAGHAVRELYGGCVSVAAATGRQGQGAQRGGAQRDLPHETTAPAVCG